MAKRSRLVTVSDFRTVTRASWSRRWTRTSTLRKTRGSNAGISVGESWWTPPSVAWSTTARSCPITREYEGATRNTGANTGTRLDAVRGISWHFATRFHRAQSNFVTQATKFVSVAKGATSVAL